MLSAINFQWRILSETFQKFLFFSWCQNKDILAHNQTLSEYLVKQKHLIIQMIVTLKRLGRFGTDASVGYVAKSLGVSLESVVKYTRRFIAGIHSIESPTVFWPDENKPVCISQQIEKQTDFTLCIELGDKNFYSHKSIYCLSAMIVCDKKKRICHCFTGWPEFSHIARAYASSQLALSLKTHFSKDQYLLGNPAYTSSMEVVSEYKKPSNDTLSANNVLFNQLHTNLYVQIEHCIIILKSRFESLKDLHTSVHDKYSLLN
ncbi:hypothetical protein PHYBLDRAFT_61071 [Phycomyces blakesleeanus NRRL 1555(-)]|uniref:DDE Tnp4 domain-containing protein n=1 Tax=Phycomyces blakesleeanus (strain ATCC 8743b / DSM 1359 / FGSC 10004 / NBRC 33097 / NRRL 1555) TaxID=763407 RepID=A0A163APF7_PHYB8|nr:hypothetical protein PHYBLDRAFT_61071 [Phycomyces blakesleeanus NRRL 1555(-)]OAD74881.1 hypothetical protein PHYBLDRAFT_61071 [Phycomyces blakesleeanus NRRL 1555(-)]|eukprot:XP_018292921.1 hypothetical protein PHYBLDRAFT_61071 [Phycomyces blakesleeanus NRRL 1555(-)]